LSETWGVDDVLRPWGFHTPETDTGYTDASDGYDSEDRFTRFRRSDLPSGSQTLGIERLAPASGSGGSIGNISSVSLTGNPANNGALLGNRDYNLIHGLNSIDPTGEILTQAFDTDGNLDTSHNGTIFEWENASLRLSSATVPTGSTFGVVGTHEYGYQATGRRAWKTVDVNGVNETTTLYIYSGPNCIAEYTITGATATLKHEVVFADRIDSPVLLARNNNAQRYNMLTNHQWSVIALADATQTNATIVELYAYDAYDAFGSRTVLSSGGVIQSTGTQFGNPFGFTARRHDAETGLMYFRNRIYDPQTSDFLSTDPKEFVDGMSMFRFYGGLSGVDPLGLERQNGQDVPRPNIPKPGDTNGDGEIDEIEQDRLDMELAVLVAVVFGPPKTGGAYRPLSWLDKVLADPSLDLTPIPIGAIGRIGVIAGTRGLRHSFGRHGAQWFGRHGGKASLLAWEELIKLASKSKKVVSWSTSGDKTIGRLARIDGNKYFFVQFFTEGKHAGELATAFIPSPDQLRAILRALR